MTKSRRQIRILVTGGGSGGHVTPALATIEAIEALAELDGAWKPTFLYVGSHGGIERKLASDAGLPFTAISTGKLRRSHRLLGHVFLAKHSRRAATALGRAAGADHRHALPTSRCLKYRGFRVRAARNRSLAAARSRDHP